MIVSRDDKKQILNIFLERLETNNKLIEKYRYKPLEFLATKGSYYPPKQEQMFMDLYTNIDRGVWLGPRGGGKTFEAGDLASCLFLFKEFDVLIGSGSDAQAQKVYRRIMQILDDDKEIEDYVPTLSTTITRGRNGNWIEFVPASAKRARGPHPGEGKRGGLIILDEECEMDVTIVDAIMGTGGTAKPLKILRASTAHKVEGSFIDLVDEPEKKGYKLYKWDAFDVASRCERNCEDCVPEFREDYCQGKAKKNSVLGWIQIDYLFDMWDEMNKEWFEVELMGRRPGGAGNVIAPADLKAALVEDAPYVPGCQAVIGLDWGFKGMAAAVANQMLPSSSPAGDSILSVFDRTHWTRKGIEEIVKDLNVWRDIYGTEEVYADSSHPFENDSLRKAGFTVTEVTFVSFKEAGAGAVKGFFEKLRIRIPKRFKDLIESLKHWKRGKDGKIIKKEDHFADALLCTMYKWWKKAGRHASYTHVSRR